MVVGYAVVFSSGSFGKMAALVAQASPVVQGVIGVLALFFAAFVFISVYKAVQLARAQRQTRKFLAAFWDATRLDEIFQAAERWHRSPVAQLFKAGYVELSKLKGAGAEKSADETSAGAIGNVERALRRAATAETMTLESMVPFLATIGSTAPFVGLFGTVVGIMLAFMEIHATGSAGMDVVAAGISEALIATAIGLVAAIPAVMAYNHFLRRIRVLSSEMENFSADFLNIVKRHFLK